MGEQISPAQILDLSFSYLAPNALLSAAELRLFTVLAAGPLPAESLRVQLGLHPRGALDFFDALVALGLIERENGYYRNTAATDFYLDRNKATYIGGWLEMLYAGDSQFWGRLTEGLRTGQPRNEVGAGGDFFQVLYEDPTRLHRFVSAMTGASMGSARSLAHVFPWQDVRTVIDVGTAQGNVPVQLALVHPHLTCGGFDLPVVGPIFRDYVASFGLADRLTFYPGDFFVQDLPQADVLVMGNILADWNLEQRRLLLAKAYDALPAGGTLIVYDQIIADDRRGDPTPLLSSLMMLMATSGGATYTGAECQEWMRATGFRESYVAPLCGADKMVVARK